MQRKTLPTSMRFFTQSSSKRQINRGCGGPWQGPSHPLIIHSHSSIFVQAAEISPGGVHTPPLYDKPPPPLYHTGWVAQICQGGMENYPGPDEGWQCMAPSPGTNTGSSPVPAIHDNISPSNGGKIQGKGPRPSAPLHIILGSRSVTLRTSPSPFFSSSPSDDSHPPFFFCRGGGPPSILAVKPEGFIFRLLDKNGGLAA